MKFTNQVALICHLQKTKCTWEISPIVTMRYEKQKKTILNLMVATIAHLNAIHLNDVLALYCDLGKYERLFRKRSLEMVKIKIGSEGRNMEDVDSSWINQQINRRRKDGPVCVRITINDGAIDMTLSLGDYSQSAGGKRLPRSQEKGVFSLRDKHGLNEVDFPSGHLVAFVKQLQKLLN